MVFGISRVKLVERYFSGESEDVKGVPFFEINPFLEKIPCLTKNDTKKWLFLIFPVLNLKKLH